MPYRERPKSPADLPKELLPREKMERLGASALSEEELWALVIGSGTKGFSVLEIASELANLGLKRISNAEISEISKIPGVGRAKAMTIKAIAELCRRSCAEERQKPRIDDPSQLAGLVKPLITQNKEHLFVVALTVGRRLLGVELVAVGGMTALSVKPREIFKPVLEKDGYFFALVHNHPGGEAKPSPEDLNFTRRIQKAGELLGLEMLDHLILGEEGYFSFRENGLLK